jgi:serine/threonine protein kinase/WD40 repeat protein
MSQRECPGVEAWRALLLGELSEVEAAPLERHLLTCPACAARLEALEGENTLVQAMRAQVSDAAWPRGEAVERLMSRLERISHADPHGEQTAVRPLSPPALPGSDSLVTPFLGPSPRPEPRTPAIPGYEVLGELGRGGMGVVYRARQLGLNRTVALKMILAGGHASAEDLGRFRAEAEAVARLRHPNIVQVYEVGEADGRPYFSLEFCSGGSLADRLRRGPLPASEAARLLEQVVLAVHAAHLAGIVHRDLKPANVLLSRRASSLACPAEEGKQGCLPYEDEPKVSDFGLAKRLDATEGLTETGDILGTPSYMAPEQADGRLDALGPATDVYALGAILYECLTGRPPFRDSSVRETLTLVCQADPVPPRQLHPHCPRDLETICLKCLRKEPGKRYASASALAADLRRFRSHEPILARPVSLGERLVKWAKRRPTLAAVTAALSLAVVALLGLGFYFSQRVGEARGALEAEEARTTAARQLAQTHEFFGLLRAVEKRSAQPQPGWTWDNGKDLAAAVRLPPAAAHQAALRTEVAAALAGIDVRPGAVVGEGFDADRLAFHPGGRQLALGQARVLAGPCAVRLQGLGPKAESRDLTFQARAVRHPSRGLVPDGVRALAFSPDGRWLVAGTRSGWLYCWDLTRQPPAPVSWSAHAGGVDWLRFSRDGTALFSLSPPDRTLRRWPCRQWDQAARGLTPAATWKPAACALGLAVHPTEGWLACATDDGKTHFLAPDTLQPLRPPLACGCKLCEVAPEGSSLAFAAGNRIEFLNLRRDERQRRLDARDSDGAEDGRITDLAFSPDGALLLSASEDSKHVKLWERAGGRLVADLSVGDGAGKAVFSPDGRSLAVAADRRTLLYEIGGLREQTFVALQGQPILACALHPDGRSLACLGPSVWGDGLRDVTIRSLAADLPGQGGACHTFAAAPPPDVDPRLSFSPLTQVLACTSAGRLTFRDGAGTAVEHALPDVREASLSFAPDGRLWGGLGDVVRSWDGVGKELAGWSNRWPGGLAVLPEIWSVSAGRTRVVAGGRDGRLHLFTTAEVKTLWSKKAADTPLRSVALSADETLAAAGSDRGDVRLLRTADGETLSALTPHRDRVEALAWSGRLLASGSGDRTVKLWDYAGGKLTELLTLRQPDRVRWLAFHPDGVRLFVLLDRERAVRVWHLDRLRARLTELALGEDLEGIEGRALPPAVPEPPPAPPVAVLAEGPNGLRAELFADRELRHCVKVRHDAQINFAWAEASLDPLLSKDAFSVRWSGWLKAPRPGRYKLRLESAGGSRLWLDDRLLIDRWQARTGLHTVEVELTGRPHKLRVEYVNQTGGAGICLSWVQRGGFSQQPVPSAALFHAPPGAAKILRPPAGR